jgi:hypothetical protein
MKKNSKKKQGDPGKRSPRSPWGLPKPAKKVNPVEKRSPEKRNPEKSQPENLKERERQQVRLGNQFLMKPLPKGMRELLVEVRQRPFPGSLRCVNIGIPSPQKYSKKLNGEKLKFNGGSKQPQATNASPKNTTESLPLSSLSYRRLVRLLRKPSQN